MDQETKAFESWAVLELFGHKKIAGFVTEATIGGAALIRVDIPKEDGSISHTRFLGAAAIYSLNPVSKEVALRYAQTYVDRPVESYELRIPTQPALPARGSSAEDPYGSADPEDWSDEEEEENPDPESNDNSGEEELDL